MVFAVNLDVLVEKAGSIEKSYIIKYSAISLIVLLTLFNTFMVLESTEIFETEITYQDVIPKGEPEVYGATMGISYQDVSETSPQTTEDTIEEMAQHDRGIELEDLSQEERQRYTEVGTKISCEYCCDVPSIVWETGEMACVCEHSFAMRGLAKYLITEHGGEFNNEEILEELGKWKIRFFPDQHMEKAEVLDREGHDVDYISLTSNEHRGIEQNRDRLAGDMVGSC